MDAQVCIIGAGPAGLMSAIYCAAARARTIVPETNTVAGRKLLLTGGGRCNFTHQATPAELIRAIGPKGKFLSYCLHEFTPEKVRQFFRQRGLGSKVDETGCVFPVSERASEVRDVLVREAVKLGVRFCYGKRVEDITRQPTGFAVRTAGNVNISTDKVILATGGLSYPQTGCTGAGYELARRLGHTIIEPRPALVPLVTRESWPSKLAGTAIDNVKIKSAIIGRKYAATGPLLFTDDGIAGPAVLDLSRFLTDYLPNERKPIQASIDLLAGSSELAFERQLLDQIAANPRKTISNVLAGFISRRVALALCEQTSCEPQLLSGQLKKDTRRRLLHIVKSLPLSIVRTRPISEATVTRGGVSTDEIDPKTMQSKICPGLFFAGEILDVDGPCGGYNLQICWSTAAIAGTMFSMVDPKGKLWG